MTNKSFLAYLLAGGGGFLALWLAPLFPFLGSNLIALFLGILFSPLLNRYPFLNKGLTVIGKKGLQYGIVLLGFRLSFRDIQTLGVQSYLFSLPFLLVLLFLALWLGRRLGNSQKQSLLIGLGTGICGGSAIATASPIVEAEEQEVGLALSTIFVYNLLALLVFPLVGRFFQLPEQVFGFWAGLAINDTSSVVASSYGYGAVAGQTATVVKLARTLLIVPACLAISLIGARGKEKLSLKQVVKLVPTFVMWFLIASVLASVFQLPSQFLTASRWLSQWLMASSLFAVGSKMSLSQFKQAGLPSLILGGLLWGILSSVSLILILIFLA